MRLLNVESLSDVWSSEIQEKLKSEIYLSTEIKLTVICNEA